VNIGMDKWGETTREAEKELDRRLAQGEEIAKAQEGWAKLLYDICGIEGAVADPIVDKWPSGAGETVKITLPAHMNIDALRGYEAELAGALHLPKGGGVAFSAGGPEVPRNVVFIAITRKNLMSGAIPYPSLSPSTVNKPIGFGRIGNGTEASLNLKDEGALAVGAQGSGKTALMKTVGLGYVRCDDGILWDMDTSAKMSAPFINPYLRHGIGVPLVDWPATTPEECELMVIAARAIISARKTYYADLLEDENVDNLPARPDLPAILIRVDETKSMSDAAAEGLDWIIEEGRSVNVRVMNTGLRATRDFVTASANSRCSSPTTEPPTWRSSPTPERSSTCRPRRDRSSRHRRRRTPQCPTRSPRARPSGSAWSTCSWTRPGSSRRCARSSTRCRRTRPALPTSSVGPGSSRTCARAHQGR
jgi:S-DNA-T family DNA segregation ATPase FtsK/SpoIIIE